MTLPRESFTVDNYIYRLRAVLSKETLRKELQGRLDSGAALVRSWWDEKITPWSWDKYQVEDLLEEGMGGKRPTLHPRDQKLLRLLKDDDAYDALLQYVAYNVLGMAGATSQNLYASRDGKFTSEDLRELARVYSSQVEHGTMSDGTPYSFNYFTNALLGMGSAELIQLRRDVFSQEFEWKWREQTRGMLWEDSTKKAMLKSSYTEYVDAKLAGSTARAAQVMAGVPTADAWVFTAADSVYSSTPGGVNTAWEASVRQLLPSTSIPDGLKSSYDVAIKSMEDWTAARGLAFGDAEASLFTEYYLSVATSNTPSPALTQLLSSTNEYLYDKAYQYANGTPDPPRDVAGDIVEVFPLAREVFGMEYDQLPDYLKNQLAEAFTLATSGPLATDIDPKTWDWRIRAMVNVEDDDVTRVNPYAGRFVDGYQMEGDWDGFFQTVSSLLSVSGSQALLGSKEVWRQRYLGSIRGLSPSQVMEKGGFGTFLHDEVLGAIIDGSSPYELANADQLAKDKKAAALRMEKIAANLAAAGADPATRAIAAMGVDASLAGNVAAGFVAEVDETEDAFRARVMSTLTWLAEYSDSGKSAEELYNEFDSARYFYSPSRLTSMSDAEASQARSDARAKQAAINAANLLAVSDASASIQELVSMGMTPSQAAAVAASFIGKEGETDEAFRARVKTSMATIGRQVDLAIDPDALYPIWEAAGYFTPPSVVAARNAADLAAIKTIARASGDRGYAALIDAGLTPQLAQQLSPAFAASPGETAAEYDKRVKDLAKTVSASINANKKEGAADIKTESLYTSFRTTGGFDSEADWNLSMGTPDSFLRSAGRKPSPAPSALTAQEGRGEYMKWMEEIIGGVDPYYRNKVRKMLLQEYEGAVGAWMAEKDRPPSLPEDPLKAQEASNASIQEQSALQQQFLDAALRARNISPEQWAEIVKLGSVPASLGPGKGATPEQGGPAEGYTGPTTGEAAMGTPAPSAAGPIASNQPAGVANTFPVLTSITADYAQKTYSDIMASLYQPGAGGYTDYTAGKKKQAQATSFGDWLRTNAPDLSAYRRFSSTRAPIRYVR